ncbi:MAG: hypothetical protein DRI90_00370 [Deltaproteobacteria bacterium]|nr:MAG: hypothetical protein DRI90_00370 [Deltaproteobacteria bacterium]
MNRSSIRALSVCAISIGALSAVGCEDPPPPLGGTLPLPEPLLSRDGFCKLVFEAPRRHLEARCSAEEMTRPAYRYLIERAARLATQCRDDWGVDGTRVQLPFNAAMGCAEALERVSWKTSLLTDDLSRIPACAKLTVGTQPVRGGCSDSRECQPGLWCGGAQGGREGRCQKPVAVGKPCGPLDSGLKGVTISSCQGGSYCGAQAARSPSGAPAGRQAGGGPTDQTPPEHQGREVRRQAAEHGMIALLNSGGSPDWSWRELDKVLGVGSGVLDDPFTGPLGLSGVGGRDPRSGEQIGHGAGYGQGSSGWTARRGRRAQVRLGTLAVSGRLPSEVVRRITRYNLGRFKLCHDNGLRDNPALQGRVTVRIVIGRDGEVSNVAGGGDLPDKSVVSCVTRAFHDLRFPQPESGIVTASVPIVFTPPELPVADPATAASTVPVASASARAAPSASGYDGAPPSPAVSPNLCILVKKLGDRCTATPQCAPGLTCRASECRKRKLAVAGGKCDGDEDCTAGLYCDQTCRKVKPTGQDCVSASQCAGACGADGKCIALCGAG